jgi:hypothetical protein
MSTLPPVLRSVPKILYAAAVLHWIYDIATNLSLITSVQEIADGDSDKTALIAIIIKSSPFIAGFLDAAFMAANGVIIHILIAIHDKMKGAME